jgi:hypothetical protein
VIQTQFFNWSSSGLNYDAPPYEACSPNLTQLLTYLVTRWGGYTLGCHHDRTIRDGTSISAHAYGAALDWRYTPVGEGQKDINRAMIVQVILPWLIDHSAELHLDAIHDYYGSRIWRAGRTPNIGDAHSLWWKPNDGSGMGDEWATYLHLETHRQGFTDDSPISGRVAIPTTGVHVLKYQVVSGDSYWKIAERVYEDGDGSRWPAISAANGGKALHPGDIIVIPGKVAV